MAEKKRFFYGWLILLTCILIMGLGYAPLVDVYKRQLAASRMQKEGK